MAKINNKNWVTILFFGIISSFFVVALIFWTIVPYFQMRAYFKYRSAGRLDKILTSDFVFSPFTYVQMFIRKDILLHMTTVPITRTNQSLLDKSITEIEELLRYNSFYPSYYILLAGAYGEKAVILKDPNFLKKAEDTYKKAIELSPKQQKFYYSYAGFLLSQRRNEEAREILKQTLLLNNQARLSRFYYGLAETTAGPNYYADALDNLEFFFASGFSDEYGEDHFLNPDPGWVKSKEIYRKFLSYFYEKGDKERVLKVAKRLSELDRAQSTTYAQIVEIINHTGVIPIIEFRK